MHGRRRFEAIGGVINRRRSITCHHLPSLPIVPHHPPLERPATDPWCSSLSGPPCPQSGPSMPRACLVPRCVRRRVAMASPPARPEGPAVTDIRPAGPFYCDRLLVPHRHLPVIGRVVRCLRYAARTVPSLRPPDPIRRFDSHERCGSCPRKHPLSRQIRCLWYLTPVVRRMVASKPEDVSPSRNRALGDAPEKQELIPISQAICCFRGARAPFIGRAQFSMPTPSMPTPSIVLTRCA
jgi:hypothetical protein